MKFRRYGEDSLLKQPAIAIGGDLCGAVCDLLLCLVSGDVKVVQDEQSSSRGR